MAPATTAIGQSASDFATFHNSQALLVAAALAIAGAVAYVVGLVRRKLGLAKGLRSV